MEISFLTKICHEMGFNTKLKAKRFAPARKSSIISLIFNVFAVFVSAGCTETFEIFWCAKRQNVLIWEQPKWGGACILFSVHPL